MFDELAAISEKISALREDLPIIICDAVEGIYDDIRSILTEIEAIKDDIGAKASIQP